jgi:hypothetical protein
VTWRASTTVAPTLRYKHDRDQKMMRHRQAPDHRVVFRDLKRLVRGGNAVADGFVASTTPLRALVVPEVKRMKAMFRP